MKWTTKATVQNVMAKLPASVGDSLYHQMQRRVGGLRNPKGAVKTRFGAAVDIWDAAKTVRTPVGANFFEVGTGHLPVMPVAFWLMGAGSVQTVDLHRRVQADLFDVVIGHIASNPEEVSVLLGDRLDHNRLDELISSVPAPAETIMTLMKVVYRAPFDARSLTSAADPRPDFHVSNTVLEHIDPPTLDEILASGAAALPEDGALVHRIDYSDHFSHGDSTVSAVNFLQYSEDKWRRYADNRFMYMNRLRDDDMQELFARHSEVSVFETRLDDEVGAELAGGRITLAEPFRSKPHDVLRTTRSTLIGRPLTHRG